MRVLLRLFVLVVLMLVACVARAQDDTQRIAELGTCTLASGETIRDCRVGYRTYGSLNAARDNAVLMPTWLNGRSEDLAGLFGAAPSPARLVDTSRFFGVALDAFGDGVSSSPSNSAAQAGTRFPQFTLEDCVRAQYRVLTEVLHVRHAHAAVGLSMGAHQVFAWAVLYPGFVDRAVSIVGSPQVTPYDLLSKQTVLDAIESDPAYAHGNYTAEPLLTLANELGALIVSAPAYRNGETSRADYAAWLAKLRAPQRQDANDRVWQLRAILRQDVLHGRALADTARGTPVKFLVIAAAEDRMVVPEPALQWAAATGAPSYLSPGACAHLIMNCDAANVAERVQAFLTAPAPVSP